MPVETFHTNDYVFKLKTLSRMRYWILITKIMKQVIPRARCKESANNAVKDKRFIQFFWLFYKIKQQIHDFSSSHPPTPPPLPSFLLKNNHNFQNHKSNNHIVHGKHSNLHRKVKLILPNEPPGETSTDDLEICAPVSTKVLPTNNVFNNKSKIDTFISSPGKPQIPPRPPILTPRRRPRKSEKFFFIGQVINIMTSIISLIGKNLSTVQCSFKIEVNVL